MFVYRRGLSQRASGVHTKMRQMLIRKDCSNEYEAIDWVIGFRRDNAGCGRGDNVVCVNLTFPSVFRYTKGHG